MKYRLLLILGCLVCTLSVASAQERVEKRYSIFFRVNNSEIDRTYLENGHVIETMVEDIKTTLAVDGYTPDSLLIYASASPEGSYELNEKLAHSRANATKAFILEVLPELASANIKIESRPNDWSGLIQTLKSAEAIPNAAEILKVLTDPRVADKEAALRRLPGVYEYIRTNMLHKMRTATVTIRVVGKVDEFTVVPELVLTSEDNVTFPSEGATRKISYQKTVSDDVLPVVTCDADWVESVTAAADGIYVTAKPNMLAEGRSTPLTVECYGKSETITISQDAADPVMTVTSESPMEFAAEGGEGEITYERNSSDETLPTIKSNAKWVTVNTVDPDNATFKVAENKSDEPRSAAVTVDCYGDSYEVVVNQAAAEKVEKPFYMDIKTNMLYDVALVPNIGAEFYLGKNFSVVGNWMYSWWKSDKVAWYWRTYGGDLGVRYWFGKAAKEKPLTGHHVGLYGQIITYDFELGGRGYLGDKWTYGGGIEYGYSLPVAERLNIDFNLGLGYLGGEYKEYLPIDGHYVWQVTKRRQYLGPTKAEISLVWLIGRGNVNKEKGGKR